MVVCFPPPPPGRRSLWRRRPWRGSRWDRWRCLACLSLHLPLRPIPAMPEHIVEEQAWKFQAAVFRLFQDGSAIIAAGWIRFRVFATS